MTTLWSEDHTFGLEMIEPQDGEPLITCYGDSCAKPLSEFKVNQIRRVFGVLGRKVEVLPVSILTPAQQL